MPSASAPGNDIACPVSGVCPRSMPTAPTAPDGIRDHPGKVSLCAIHPVPARPETLQETGPETA